MKNRKKQTRLSFTPALSSSPQRSEAYVRVDSPSTASKRRRIISDSDPDSSDRQVSPDLARAISLSRKHGLSELLKSPRGGMEQLPTPEPSSQVMPPGEDATVKQRRSRRVNSGKHVAGATTRSSRGSPNTQVISDSDDWRPVSASTSEGQNVKFATSKYSSEASDEEVSPPKPSRTPTIRSFFAGGSSGTAPISDKRRNLRGNSLPKKSERAIFDSSSSEEEGTTARQGRDGIRSTYNTRHRQRGKTLKDRANKDEDGDVVLAAPSRRHTSMKRIDISSDEEDKEKEENNEDEEQREDDSDVVPTTPSRRRLISRRLETPKDDDDDSMLEELCDAENDETQKRETRKGQGNSARAKRLQNLSRLRQRRAGVVQISDEPESEHEEEEQPEEEIGDEFEHTDQDASSNEEKGSKGLDDYESDFIEDDGEIGIDLMKHGVPLEFTGHANKKPYDYFKHAVEWMVHNKLDPAFERHDEIYELAHKKLDDEYLGLAKSEYESSVWTEDFIKALKRRPELSTVQLGPEIMEDKCQACNRTKHPPKWLLKFSGPTYDKKSLEKENPKAGDESSSESDEETGENDEKPEEWLLGSVCCGNAEVAHSLYHWRFQLNATILEWLVLNKYTEPLQVVEREEWSRRKKEKFANRIVDGMVEHGEMESLYKEFKQNLNAAIATRDEKAQHGSWKGKKR